LAGAFEADCAAGAFGAAGEPAAKAGAEDAVPTQEATPIEKTSPMTRFTL